MKCNFISWEDYKNTTKGNNFLWEVKFLNGKKSLAKAIERNFSLGL